MTTSCPTTVDEWFVNLSPTGRDEALRCLTSGSYSRGLITSLRAAFPLTPEHQHGLDDPRAVQAGDPLGATLQTLLRDRFLSPVRAGSVRYHVGDQGVGVVVDRSGDGGGATPSS